MARKAGKLLSGRGAGWSQDPPRRVPTRGPSIGGQLHDLKMSRSLASLCYFKVHAHSTEVDKYLKYCSDDAADWHRNFISCRVRRIRYCSITQP